MILTSFLAHGPYMLSVSMVSVSDDDTKYILTGIRFYLGFIGQHGSRLSLC